MKKILLLFFTLIASTGFAQEGFPVNGVRDVKPELYAFINARIVVDADQTLENATMIVRKGKIENIGTGITPPKGARVFDLKGKMIYPSFIDIYTSYGLQETKKGARPEGPQFISNKKGAYNWNEAIRSEYNAYTEFSISEDKAAELRKQGFGTVLSINKDGIMRGTSVLVSLGDKSDNEVILKDKVTSNLSFGKGSSTQDYPSSLMGSIALIRQTFYDAAWYKSNKGIEYNISLDAINTSAGLPLLFETNDVYDIFRAQKIADEFGMKFIYKVSGNEYQQTAELKKINPQLIISLNFPKAYDVEDYYDALNVSLAELKHWELAPYNAAILEKEKISFAITSSDLKNSNDFLKNLRKAIQNGLTEKQALRALTSVPAGYLKIEDRAGSLKKGMPANFLVTSDNIFKENTSILENWVNGTQFIIEQKEPKNIRGIYKLAVKGLPETSLTITGDNSPEASLLGKDSVKSKVYIKQQGDIINLIYDISSEEKTGKIRLNGTISATEPFTLKGEATLADGSNTSWSAVKTAEESKTNPAEEQKKTDSTGKVIYPFVAFGYQDVPQAEKILIRNATVWTNEKEGKIENADVLIDKGKIVAVGKNISAAGGKIIDGTGKHITPGIIDEHSHIAITRGVNEGTQAVTSEVRIGDVIEPDDINIYRQLSGGVTTSQLLHGSANPIGGQAALIKLRWGKTAEEMKFAGADPFIKFALGENVKQSNWGDRQRVRFPQTRMGVEQVYFDAFIRAKEYEKQLNAYNKSKKNGIAPRRDLELDALVEILNHKRFITCHSYVQSEINMLMKVADSMGFTVNTFTHILEGYKVADKMKKHGAGASTFSDWWAYKYEVIDAIPYNGSIMTKMGLVTAYNSDDAEMARRLNQEAAKAVKYGNVSEEEALKFVTLNPAKLLHIDQKVGSIKAGKDADLVLWTDHPLSIYAKAEKTFVDGIAYYDQEKDEAQRKWVKAERERLIQKLLIEKKIGTPTQKPAIKEKKLYHCDDMLDEVSY